ncbi:alginate export family protein [Candidatus Omnitrophota bacterium]
MFKKVALLCALLAVVAYPASAEVQNIKVSGDITAAAIYRNNYDMEDQFWTNALGWQNVEDQHSYLQSNTRLRIDADLTDNVATTIRLVNMREWDVPAATTNDINLDLASITLKEMLYSPLTLIIGRQELMYGRGMIVGPALYQDPDGSTFYDDFSPMHGFDAVRAILDYDPWTFDMFMAKIVESDNAVLTDSRDDLEIDLGGLNVGYQFANYNAEAEGYIFYTRDETYGLTMYDQADNATATMFGTNTVYTGGLRGSTVYNENLALYGEIAGQWGEIEDNNGTTMENELTRDRQALMANVGGQYTLADIRFVPTLGLQYLYLSGEDVSSSGNPGDEEHRDTDDFEAWDPMYRSTRLSTIRDLLEGLFVTNDPADTSGATNQHTIQTNLALDLGELVDGLRMNLSYAHFWFDEEPSYTNQDDEVGDELDLSVTYDYTEDVQFALEAALFMAGDYYDEVHASRVMQAGGMNAGGDAITNRVANDNVVLIAGSCKVNF